MIKEGFDGSEPDVAETVRKAAKSLESLGATVEEISFPAHANGKTESSFFPKISIHFYFAGHSFDAHRIQV